MEHCFIFSREIFYVTIVLCFNLGLKPVNEITAWQTRTGSRKHDVIKVRSNAIFKTTQIELALPS